MQARKKKLIDIAHSKTNTSTQLEDETFVIAVHALVSLIPSPSRSFPSLAVWLSRRRPGAFSHVSDIRGRKILIDCGQARLEYC